MVPLGLMPTRGRGPNPTMPTDADAEDDAVLAGRAGRPSSPPHAAPPEPLFKIGMLPVARRDTERLRQLLAVQRRLQDMDVVAARQAGADASRAVRGRA